MRPEVQRPAPSRSAVMFSLPAPSSATLAVELLAVSTEPVPQLAAPPGYCVPVRISQFALAGDELAGPSKVSCQTVVQPGSGSGGGVLPVEPYTWNSHSE